MLSKMVVGKRLLLGVRSLGYRQGTIKICPFRIMAQDVPVHHSNHSLPYFTHAFFLLTVSDCHIPLEHLSAPDTICFFSIDWRNKERKHGATVDSSMDPI